MRRKTPRARLYLTNLRGVTTTDPGGYATVVPFTNTGQKYLDDTGQFTEPINQALAWIPLSTGAEPLEIVSDGAGQVVMVAFDPTE